MGGLLVRLARAVWPVLEFVADWVGGWPILWALITATATGVWAMIREEGPIVAIYALGALALALISFSLIADAIRAVRKHLGIGFLDNLISEYEELGDVHSRLSLYDWAKVWGKATGQHWHKLLRRLKADAATIPAQPNPDTGQLDADATIMAKNMRSYLEKNGVLPKGRPPA